MGDNRKLIIKDSMDKQFSKARSGEFLFLSTERAEKYDLLLHLLENLQQPLILVGPEGIGKTTFLQKLQGDKADDWQICYVQCNAKISTKNINETLLENLSRQSDLGSDATLANVLASYESRNVKVVLLIDDAALLKPSLVAELCQFAAVSKILRIVFSLISGQVEKLNATSDAIDGCYFIEIPTLSKWQCAKYLQNLSVNPANQIDIKRISPDLVGKVHVDTAGVPGKVLTYFTKNARLKKRVKDRDIVLVSVGLLVGMISYTLVAGLPEVVAKEEQIATKQAKILDINNSEILAPINLQKLSSQPDENGNKLAFVGQDETPNIAPEKLQGSSSTSNEKKQLTQISIGSVQQFNDLTGNKVIQVIKPADQLSESNLDISLDNDVFDHQWILEQPDSNYTLQLIVLSDLNKAIAVKKEHESFENPITLFRADIKGNKRYVLLSGSFTDLQAAKQASKRFPKPFHQSWLRKLGSVKKELQQNT